MNNPGPNPSRPPIIANAAAIGNIRILNEYDNLYEKIPKSLLSNTGVSLMSNQQITIEIG